LATYGDLATVGPSVVLTLPTGTTKALVILTAAANGSQGGSATFMSMSVTGGATTINPSDGNAFGVSGNDAIRASATVVLTGLSSGVPLTFTAKYRVSSGTGTWATRDITVIPLPG
jgi:hypothetical protein